MSVIGGGRERCERGEGDVSVIGGVRERCERGEGGCVDGKEGVCM